MADYIPKLNFKDGPPEKDDIPTLIENLRGRTATNSKPITLTRAEAGFYLWYHALGSPDKKGAEMCSGGALSNIIWVIECQSSEVSAMEKSMAIGLLSTLSSVDINREVIMFYKCIRSSIMPLLRASETSCSHTLATLHNMLKNKDARSKIMKDDVIDWPAIVKVLFEAQLSHSYSQLYDAGWTIALCIMHKDSPKVDEKDKGKKDEAPLTPAQTAALLEMARKLKQRLVGLGILEPLVGMLHMDFPPHPAPPAEAAKKRPAGECIREVAMVCLWKLCQDSPEHLSMLEKMGGIEFAVKQLAHPAAPLMLEDPKSGDWVAAKDEQSWMVALDRRASAAGLLYELCEKGPAATRAKEAGAVALFLGHLHLLMGPGGPMGGAAAGGKKAKKKKGAAVPANVEIALTNITGSLRRLAVDDNVKTEIVEGGAIPHVLALSATQGPGRAASIRLNARGVLTCCGFLAENLEALKGCNTPEEFILDNMLMHRDELFDKDGRPVPLPGAVAGGPGIRRPGSPDYEPPIRRRPSTLSIVT